MFKRYKFYRQLDQMDCGPTCLKIIGAFYGKKLNLETLRQYCQIDREGVSLHRIATAAEKIGFHSRGARVLLPSLENAILPCILHWNQNHFVVLFKCSKGKYLVADPAKGIISYNKREFLENWSQGRETGIALILDPLPSFFSLTDEPDKPEGLGRFLSYMRRFKSLFLQLILGYGIGVTLQAVLPFLTQSIVDVGIPTQDIGFINLILIAQFSLLLGRTFVDFIRSWILLHISARLNILVLTEFLSKLMRLPISFFDSKKTGDILQRIDDQKRIESFLTGQTISVGFSMLSFVLFSFILAFYDLSVFLVFFFGSTLYVLWIIGFLDRRKHLDYKRFEISSKTQSKNIQLIQGMQEIKLSGTEKRKRWEWEHLQAKLFFLNVKSLTLGQYQQIGGVFFNEGKNILIIFLVAMAVINGEMSLGQMIAIQYILGQLNGPIDQFLSFVQSYQDAKLSLGRLNELFNIKNEEDGATSYLTRLPAYSQIKFDNLCFGYPGNGLILKDINFAIPKGKVTAIVGESGSGKSTLIKLLLGFYEATQGSIYIGDIDLGKISPNYWRMQCGVVTQDSFIFSDTIMANIALSEKDVDWNKLDKAIKLARLEDYINSLPLGLNTLIGPEGNGISQGQRQRILIARTIYKEPEFIMLDEATNALDANNEKEIVKNLEGVFQRKTVVVVAHRLSTVKNADKIIVLENGSIVEEGTHDTLTSTRGKYYSLVKNQLEFGI